MLPEKFILDHKNDQETRIIYCNVSMHFCFCIHNMPTGNMYNKNQNPISNLCL